MKTLALLLAAFTTAFAFTGCKSVPAPMQPQVTISTTEISNLKALLIADGTGEGYVIEQDGENLLVLAQPEKAAGTAPSGTVASSPRKKIVTYRFTREGDSTRINATATWSMGAPGDPMHSVTADTTTTSRESLQHHLDVLKSRVEDGAQKIIP